jgi:hypothetical protein
VSRQEIVEGYLDGQLSRRVFIRRLVATGVTAAAALSYASVLDADPAAAELADYYLVMQDNEFLEVPARLELGQAFYFGNSGSPGHNARDTTGLGLFDTGPLNHYQLGGLNTPPGAGTYTFKCDETDHGRMAGSVQVPLVVDPVSGPLGSSFTVRWAPGRSPNGLVFDVQRIKAGQRNFTAWRTGVRAASANFHPAARGLYTFRARVRKVVGNRTTGWSPVKRIRVT